MSLRFAYYKYVKRRAQRSIYIAWQTSEDDYIIFERKEVRLRSVFPCFFQYLGGQGCDRAKEKKEGVGVFFFWFLRFWLPSRFQGMAPLSSKRTSASLLRVFFSHLPPPPPHFFVSPHNSSHPQRWHFDDERSRLQRDRHRRSCPPRRKVTLWTPRGDYSRRPWCDRSFLPLLEEEEEDEEKKTECVVFFPPRRRQK